MDAGTLAVLLMFAVVALRVLPIALFYAAIFAARGLLHLARR